MPLLTISLPSGKHTAIAHTNLPLLSCPSAPSSRLIREAFLISYDVSCPIYLAEAIYNEQPFDLLIHLGDIEGEEDIIQELAGGETIMVPGNNDFFSPLPREREIELAGKKVLLTHGHYYYVSLNLQTLREECIARGIDIVMFGHTHRPLIQIEDELTFINPGSISYPRQADKRCTYIMLEIDDNGEMSFNLKYV